ncbi:expressed unknown protein [Seminavis robusta]|uniref:Uncharacterized protein n=1 Tax=Seminavis robusta TaxID=568900 RepID=A0A9N8EGV2_9STRA|nr:expressed unknown protein [Seminavis robusta]|eukprot:Sro1061_g236750.1 n/a (380) ;mRNA; r:991-2216
MDALFAISSGASSEGGDPETAPEASSLGHHIPADQDILTAHNIQHFGRKALFFQLICAIGAIVHSCLIQNEILTFSYLILVQGWFIVLVWITTLPRSPAEKLKDRKQRAGRTLLPTCLIAISVRLIPHLQTFLSENYWETHHTIIFCYPIVSVVCVCFVFAGLHHIGYCVSLLYDEPKEICWMALQFISMTLKAGFVQAALFTLVLVEMGSMSSEEWYDAINEKAPEETTKSVIQALQATTAGLAMDVFLFRALITTHILKIWLLDAVRGKMTLLEYFSIFLQLLIVVSVSAVVSMEPDFSRTTAEFTLFDFVLIFGIISPCILMCFILWYQVWVWHKCKYFKERDDRVTKLETVLLSSNIAWPGVNANGRTSWTGPVN